MPGHPPGMVGTNAEDGKALTGIEHLRQSVKDILTTPKGSRVMRRDYGSDLYRFIDAPLNRSTVLSVIQAVSAALAAWEPRIAVQKVEVSSAEPGHLVIDVIGTYTPDGSAVRVDGVEVS